MSIRILPLPPIYTETFNIVESHVKLIEDIVWAAAALAQPMTTGEDYTGAHAKYWVTTKIDYTTNILTEIEIQEWCNDIYGPAGHWFDPLNRWYISNGKYVFSNETDRTMFILKWS